MEIITVAASFLGGGLAAGCVMNLLYNRGLRQRDLRTTFYSKLNNIHSAYVIRMAKPEGQCLVQIVGNYPSEKDAKFVEHRSDFIGKLVEFNELKEARILRKQMLDHTANGHHTPGVLTKIDFAPEAKALSDCLVRVHKKLKLWE